MKTVESQPSKPAMNEKKDGVWKTSLTDADVLVENNDDLVQFQNQIRTWLATLI